MNRLLAVLSIGLTLAWAQGAFADNLPLLGVGSGSGAAPAYSGPLDVYSTTTISCYSFRACSAAIAAAGTQKLFKAIRASDSQTCDFIVATSGGIGNSANCSGAFGSGTLASFCNATTCKMVTWYDQKGATGADATQATDANRPSITISCTNGQPCIVGTGSSVGLVTGTITALSGAVTYSVVTQRNDPSSSFGGVVVDNTNDGGPGIRGPGTTANTLDVIGGGSDFTFTAADESYHSLQVVFNTTSSVANVDGAETTGSLGAVTPATARGILTYSNDTFSAIAKISEVVVYQSVMGATARGNMCHNQRLYFGTAGTC